MVGAQAAHPGAGVHPRHVDARLQTTRRRTARSSSRFSPWTTTGAWRSLQATSCASQAQKTVARRKSPLDRYATTPRRAFDRATARLPRENRRTGRRSPARQAWAEINAHLGTTATALPELVEQLGQRTFGHTPRVGDSFCGGGSIPFEAARIGCEAFGSDLNPVAGLAHLGQPQSARRWQGGAGRSDARAGRGAAAADRQVTAWGIEHNDRGERAEAYLYCVEVKPEGCDYYIPLAPSWLIGEKSKVVARWQRVPGSDRLQPEIAVGLRSRTEALQGEEGRHGGRQPRHRSLRSQPLLVGGSLARPRRAAPLDQ